MSGIHAVIAGNDLDAFDRFKRSQQNFTDYLEERDPKTGMTPLMHAAAIGNVDILLELIASGAEVHQAYSATNCATALVVAAYNNKTACVRELLNYEGDSVNNMWSAVDAAYVVCPYGSDSFKLLRQYQDEHPSCMQQFLSNPIAYMLGTNNTKIQRDKPTI